VRAEVPQRTSLQPPRRAAERIPRIEDRGEPDDAPAVPVAAVDLVLEPRADTRLEAIREEDDRGRPCSADDPLGRLDAQRQGLLEQQRPACLAGARGQLGLDVRRNGERECLDGADQSVDVGERLRTV
jgi:hypothetical protein